MLDAAVVELVSLLRSPTLRSRTGILLLAPAQLGGEEELAARLNVEALNYVEVVKAEVPPGSRFLGADAGSEEERLDRIAMAAGKRDCVLIYNVDLILAKLNHSARSRLWSYLRTTFPNRSRALILALPVTASLVQPDGEERESWERTGRIVRGAVPEPAR